jgi:probable rRNA maturation factor
MISHSKKRPANTAPDILISNRRRGRKIDLRWLEKISAAALADLNIEHAELGLVLVTAKEMASLNEEFLGHEGATDVITFDYREPGIALEGRDGALRRPRRVQRRKEVVGRSISQREIPTIQGEIFICVAEAERQAKVFGTDWRSEVVRYVVHGILHLMGYDDLQPLARKKMKREEGRLVRELSRRFALSKL